MFRHKTSEEAAAKIGEVSEVTASEQAVEEKPKHPQKITAESDLKELMEKNLKWSQIIYEQNRKINRKLAWSAVANWLRTAIIVVPIVLALWFLPSFIDKFKTTIAGFTGDANSTSGKPTYSIEQLMQLLPIGDAEKAQLKAILK